MVKGQRKKKVSWRESGHLDLSLTAKCRAALRKGSKTVNLCNEFHSLELVFVVLIRLGIDSVLKIPHDHVFGFSCLL